MTESDLDVRGTKTRVLRGGRGARPLPPRLRRLRPVATGLRRARSVHDVIRPDHPGFGLSDEDGRIDSVHDLAFFYLDLLDAFGIERVR